MLLICCRFLNPPGTPVASEAVVSAQAAAAAAAGAAAQAGIVNTDLVGEIDKAMVGAGKRTIEQVEGEEGHQERAKATRRK